MQGGQQPMPDFTVEDHGTIFFIRPETDAAKEWVKKNVSQEGYQPYYPDQVVVEHRFVQNIVMGIVADGFVVDNE